MSVKLKIPNYSSLNTVELSELNADLAAAATSLTVRTTQNMAADDYILIGRRASESAEIRKIASVTNATALVISSAVSLAHARLEEIIKLAGNKIRIYRALNVDGSQPDDGDFGLLSTMDIDPDQPETGYVDTGGSSSYWYKFTYYNSTTDTETSLGSSKAVRGGNDNNYCSIDDIRGEAGIRNNRFISDADVAAYRTEAQAEVNNALQGLYTLPFTAPINPQIEKITKYLAAGFLLLKDYGPVNSGTTKDGQKKIDEARLLLEKIKTKELVLTDATGVSSAIEGAAGFSGWPDTTTKSAATENGGGDRMFRIMDQY